MSSSNENFLRAHAAGTVLEVTIRGTVENLGSYKVLAFSDTSNSILDTDYGHDAYGYVGHKVVGLDVDPGAYVVDADGDGFSFDGEHYIHTVAADGSPSGGSPFRYEDLEQPVKVLFAGEKRS